MCTVGAQDTEDGAHDEGEYGAEEPLREQVSDFCLLRDFHRCAVLNTL